MTIARIIAPKSISEGAGKFTFFIEYLDIGTLSTSITAMSSAENMDPDEGYAEVKVDFAGFSLSKQVAISRVPAKNHREAVTVTVFDDKVMEGNEKVSIFVSSSGVSFEESPIGLSLHTFDVTIIDNDQPTQRKDEIYGDWRVNEINGLGGNDKLFGEAGDDTLDGGDGNDILIGGPGADNLIGGKGKDTASYEDAKKGVTAKLRNAKQNKGDAKGDTYKSIENLTGSKKADTLVGDDGANVLKGLGGNDKLVGGKGNDTLEGGGGKDVLTGGKGADSFVFRAVSDSPAKKKGWDVITDFRPGQGDRIDLKAIDARAGTKKNDAFTFIDRDAFSGRKGELRFDGNKKKTFVYGDVNGDKVADFRIELTGKVDLVEDDFMV